MAPIELRVCCEPFESRHPPTDAILSAALTIANGWRPVAIAWHVVLAITFFAVAEGWRPSARVAGFLLSAPFLSGRPQSFQRGCVRWRSRLTSARCDAVVLSQPRAVRPRTVRTGQVAPRITS